MIIFTNEFAIYFFFKGGSAYGHSSGGGYQGGYQHVVAVPVSSYGAGHSYGTNQNNPFKTFFKYVF